MSYIMSLDEHDEDRLRSELKRRLDARKAGLCDYCGAKAGSGTGCKLPERHFWKPKLLRG